MRRGPTIAGIAARSTLIGLPVIAAAAWIGLASARRAGAMDNGQFENVDPNIRSWFKNVHSPHGVPCCDIADGHRTTWKGDEHGTYWVPIEDQWVPVPPEAIVYDAGNPFGDAVVWYVRTGTEAGHAIWHIRCFVPGGGV
jgi:hypothetical protein